MSTAIQFFENLMSPNKDIRVKAEQDLEKMKTMPVPETINIFKEGMQSPNENIAQLSILLLQKTYLEIPEIKGKLSQDDFKLMGDAVKAQINLQGRSWKTLQRLADCLARIYQCTSLAQGISEIVNLFNNENDAISRKFAIYLIEVLSEISALTEDKIDNNAAENFKSIFSKGLNDNNVEVKIESLKALTEFLKSFTNESMVLKFTMLADMMLQTLVYALKTELGTKGKEVGENSIGKAALETINSLIDLFPKFWKDKVELIISITGEIAKTKDFPNSIREISLELVLTLCVNFSKVIKKSENFKKIFLPLLFELLLEVDNPTDIDKWEKQKEVDETDREEMFYAVRDTFDRLSNDLGDKYFMEATSPFIQRCLTSQNWIEIHAGFFAIGNMAEGCKESFKKHVLDLMNYISPALTNPHPRVRYAALFAFSNLLKETSPKPQKEYTNNILPALAQLMGEKEQSVRVKTSSCRALVEYFRGLDGKEDSSVEENVELIKPYSADLVKLVSMLFEYSLQVNYSPLQEESLTALSLLSNLLQKDFAPYYPNIMPGLKKVFSQLKADTPEQKTLKSNCIETISFLCASVAENPEDFMNDLNEICQTFILYMQELKEEDPQLATIINSFANISSSMKEKFIPVLQSLLPLLTKYINADIGMKVEDAALAEYIPEEEEAEENKLINKTGSVVLKIGNKSTKISLQTFALQNKVLAFNTFYEISTNMKQSFFQFNETLLKFSKDLMKFPYSRKIRKIAIKSVCSAMEACADDNQRKIVLDFVGDTWLETFGSAIGRTFLKEIKANLKYLNLMFTLIKTPTTFSEKFIKTLYEDLKKVAVLVQKVKKGLMDQMNADPDIDEDIINEDYDAINEVLRRVMELSGNIYKIFKTPLTALVTEYLYQLFSDNWNDALNNKIFHSDQEVLTSICFFDDYLEYSDQTAYNMVYPSFIQFTVRTKTENEDLLQSLAYGYGIICKRTPKDQFGQFQAEIMKFLIGLTDNPNIGGYTKDNALGAMGKYLYFQAKNGPEIKSIMNVFLNFLPLKEDLEESKAVFKEFYDQIKNSNPILNDESYLPLIKNALSRTKELNDEKKFLEEDEIYLRELCSKFGI
ncbi:MAG: hypothetical protein MJ252_01545 [archaeon]|nr:hypothetical protein [archaeon]